MCVTTLYTDKHAASETLGGKWVYWSTRFEYALKTELNSFSALSFPSFYLILLWIFVFPNCYSGALAAREPHTYIGSKRKPMSWFSHGFLASGIASGGVRMMTVESHKMAAILQMIGRQRHAALVYGVLLRIYDIMS